MSILTHSDSCLLFCVICTCTGTFITLALYLRCLLHLFPVSTHMSSCTCYILSDLPTICGCISGCSPLGTCRAPFIPFRY